MDYDNNFYHSLGFGEDYITKSFFFYGRTEHQVSEGVFKGEKLTPRFRMLNVNKKLYHSVCAL